MTHQLSPEQPRNCSCSGLSVFDTILNHKVNYVCVSDFYFWTSWGSHRHYHLGHLYQEYHLVWTNLPFLLTCWIICSRAYQYLRMSNSCFWTLHLPLNSFIDPFPFFLVISIHAQTIFTLKRHQKLEVYYWHYPSLILPKSSSNPPSISSVSHASFAVTHDLSNIWIYLSIPSVISLQFSFAWIHIPSFLLHLQSNFIRYGICSFRHKLLSLVHERWKPKQHLSSLPYILKCLEHNLPSHFCYHLLTFYCADHHKVKSLVIGYPWDPCGNLRSLRIIPRFQLIHISAILTSPYFDKLNREDVEATI